VSLADQVSTDFNRNCAAGSPLLYGPACAASYLPTHHQQYAGCHNSKEEEELNQQHVGDTTATAAAAEEEGFSQDIYSHEF
jgi:hypothetical protein